MHAGDGTVSMLTNANENHPLSSLAVKETRAMRFAMRIALEAVSRWMFSERFRWLTSRRRTLQKSAQPAGL